MLRPLLLALAFVFIASTASPEERRMAAGDQPARLDPAAREEPAPLREGPAIAQESAPVAANGDSVEIKGVRFEGVLVPLRVGEAARPFIGRMASRETLTELAAALSSAYERSSVALFTLAIPEQDFRDGVVRVLVKEGHVASVILTGEVEGKSLKLVKAYAEKLTQEQPTQRARLERQLSLISDIPGLTAKPAMKLSDTPGAVDLVLDLDHKRPSVAFGFDNRTSRLVRDGQLTAEGKAYRVLRDGDETALSLTAAVNLKESFYAGLSHSTPLLRDGARFDVGAAYLKSRPNGSDIEGEAQIYSAGFSYPAVRSFKRSLVFRASFDALNSDNAAFGSLLAEERIRAARFSSSYAWTGRHRALNASTTVSKGFEALGARVTAPLGRPDFLKGAARMSFTQKAGARGLLRINAAGQWTVDELPASERFSVGGASFGRAFENGLVNADRGVAFLVEPALGPIRKGPLSKSELYVFADYAEARAFQRGTTPGESFDLGSWGLGARAVFKDKGSLEFEAARPYDEPFDGYGDDWRFSVRWRIDLRPRRRREVVDRRR